MLLVYAHYAFKRIYEKEQLKWVRTALGVLIASLSSQGLLHACIPPLSVMSASSGGVIGFIIADVLLYYCNIWGAIIILMATAMVGVNLFIDLKACVIATLLFMKSMLFDDKVCEFASDVVSDKLNIFGATGSQGDTGKEAIQDEKSMPNFSGVLNKDARVAASRYVADKKTIPNTTVANTPINTVKVSGVKKMPQVSANKAELSMPDVDVSATPPLELVHMQLDAQSVREDPSRIAQLCKALEARLQDYHVQCKVLQALPGPVITRYELELAAGTKASKVSNLAKDLARSLSVPSVRVIEVIPGKTCIGIEIPNHKRQTVALHEVLESKNYQNSKARLTLALGVDISGEAIVADLAKMPHLLVAGTTGSGKSVGINGLLLSLLFKSSPEDLRLILIDPKMLELAVYDGIAHLLTPVVTDMRDAASALHWCVNEMERRYKLMSELGVRNIDGYNTKIKNNSDYDKLPYIVVIVDEFADMMMMVGKKVEQLIARLAQKARAAGVHLILATQRPSVDVITGLIKANIPTRMAYQVSSKIDSRTIIDQQGAEALLGAGDMLYLSPGSCIPVRCHSPYITDKAVLDVVAHLKEHAGSPEYINDIVTSIDETDIALSTSSSTNKSGGDDDKLYNEAVEFIIQSRRASISGVQRRLRIGYNRAATLVERMESDGIVSSMDQSGQRTVLVPKRD